MQLSSWGSSLPSLGGRPGMISGATGAVAVVIASLACSHGQEYIFATVILAGLIQLLAGIFRLVKFIRLVPQSVMYGFVNGLAIVIFMAQLVQFQAPGADGQYHWLTGSSLYVMLGFVGLTMLIIWGLPKLTRAIPSSLTAIIVVSALVIGLNIDTKTVGDMASIQGAFPPLSHSRCSFLLAYLTVDFSLCLHRCRGWSH